MAEKKKDAGAAPVAAPKDGGSSKKLIVIGGAVAVLLIAAVVAWLLLADNEETQDEEGQAAAARHATAPSIYESLGDKFVVTLQHEGRQHYLQLALSVLTREQATVEELEVHAPLIRGRLITLLGSQDFAALRTEAGKLALREQILKTIQDILQAETGKPGIEQVFFTEFVLQ